MHGGKKYLHLPDELDNSSAGVLDEIDSECHSDEKPVSLHEFLEFDLIHYARRFNSASSWVTRLQRVPLKDGWSGTWLSTPV